MASNPNPTPAPAPGKQTPWLVITLFVLLFVVAAGAVVGGAWLYMSGQSDGLEVAETGPPQPPPEPVFVAVEPFTVNLHDDRGRILYVGISLKVAGEAVASRMQSHMPQVRNRILMTLTSQEADALMTQEGKKALAGTIRDAVSEPFDPAAKPLGVSDVLFTNFIVQ